MKFDDADYHEGAALEAGQPIEHAFTHIGLVLAWMIRHDLHDPSMFSDKHVDAVRSGSWTGSDLRDDVDGKLMSDWFTRDGAAFLAARYDAYLDAYGAAFPSSGDYDVIDDASSRAVTDPILDDLYGDWLAAGRPGPSPRAEPAFEMPELADLPDIPLDQIPIGHTVVIDALTGGWEVVDPRDHASHADVAMEDRLRQLLPADAFLSSATGTQWGDSRLNRVLRDLGVRPKDVRIAHGMGGTGPGLFASLYRVPGVDAGRLQDAFAMVIHRPDRRPWGTRTIGATTVAWADGSFGASDEPAAVAYWAEDEIVLHLYGPVPLVETAVRALS